jgi:phenylacetic acid degradation operon negative regulatory protein
MLCRRSFADAAAGSISGERRPVRRGCGVDGLRDAVGPGLVVSADTVEPGRGDAAAPPATAAPATARRRAIGVASAPALLLTVLGEFVLPGGRPVWTSALVRSLAEVGVEDKAARQALARTAGGGIIRSDRAGRRVRWTLTAAGRRLLTEGAARIYGFTGEMPDWDGQWLVLAVTVPEHRRELRHKLRARLTWAGLGTPAPGLWVGPDTTKEAEVAGVIRDLGLGASAFSYVGRSGDIGDVARIVGQAWDLDEVARRYHDFVDRFRSIHPQTADEAFQAQIRLVQEWRRFPFLDPALPRDLHPTPWPGTRAAELFRRLHWEWHTDAQAHWAEIVQATRER